MRKSIELPAVLEVLLEGHKDRFNGNFRQLFESKGTRILEEEKVLRVVINPSSNSEVSLIDANTDLIKGVSDFDKNRLETEEVFIITGFKAGYATNANPGQEALLTYGTAAPASVRNARFKIIQGSVSLYSNPLATIFNPYAGNTIADDIKKLDVPPVLVGGSPFEYKLEYPNGATAATNVEYLELISVGYKVVRSTKQQ